MTPLIKNLQKAENCSFKKKAILVFVFVLISSTTVGIAGLQWAKHPIHLSLTELFVNTEKQRIEVSVKIFEDDLASIIKHTMPLTDSIVFGYLQQNMAIYIGNQKINLEWVGKENEGQAIWCYLKADISKIPLTTITLTNTILINLPGQTNLIKLKTPEEIKNFIFDAEKTTTTTRI